HNSCTLVERTHCLGCPVGWRIPAWIQRTTVLVPLAGFPLRTGPTLPRSHSSASDVWRMCSRIARLWPPARLFLSHLRTRRFCALDGPGLLAGLVCGHLAQGKVFLRPNRRRTARTGALAW